MACYIQTIVIIVVALFNITNVAQHTFVAVHIHHRALDAAGITVPTMQPNPPMVSPPSAQPSSESNISGPIIAPSVAPSYVPSIFNISPPPTFPSSLRPTEQPTRGAFSHGLRAVTVLAPSCLIAGIYATCVFVMGHREGLQFAESATGVEACVQDDQGIFRTQFFSIECKFSYLWFCFDVIFS